MKQTAVTVGVSGGAPEVANLEAAQPARAIAVLVQTPLGALVGGTLNGDMIIVSAQALGLLRAGAFVRAFIVRGLESVRRSVSLAASRQLILEHGIYRVR
ncbi:MAG: hypothetical protein M3Z37_06515 [Candidatus Eremiobacteraeota bacterium]|nr:hypothetical protein [Candidatus Eremiobacteraeota bacterium]